MKCRLWLLIVAAIGSLAPLAAGSAESNDAADRQLVIRPEPDAPWDAPLANVGKVLESAADQLWAHFPDRTLAPILVEPNGGPIVLYGRGPDGEYRVRLATGQTYWCQYAFQFAHEFCHILCNYREGGKENKWFEESICETASLFALRGMAETWRSDPPYPNWRDYSSALAKYAEQRLQKHKLPAGTTLAAWYRQHAEELCKEPCIREKNGVVAGVLLPLFEEHPEHWEAVGYLNAEALDGPRSFREYLQDWHRNVPKKHKAFVRRIAGLFDIKLPEESSGQTNHGQYLGGTNCCFCKELQASPRFPRNSASNAWRHCEL